ncbi:proteasome accessory factor C [Mycobacterium tuberculosis]|nr:proteasome accessory factor C [Mycobacterium tuberculosis]
MSALSTRLVRLLNMVPYFQANPRITRAEAAAELGVTAKQLEEDLNQLWMCAFRAIPRVTSSTSNSAVTPSR